MSCVMPFDRQAELALLRLAFLVAFLLLATQTAGKQLGAIGNGDLGRDSLPLRT